MTLWKKKHSGKSTARPKLYDIKSKQKVNNATKENIDKIYEVSLYMQAVSNAIRDSSSIAPLKVGVIITSAAKALNMSPIDLYKHLVKGFDE